jgi:hypothetical protein
VPIGFRVNSSTAEKECRFGWLKFDAEFEYDSNLSEAAAWNLLKECSASIGTAKFVAEAVVAPKIAAADAALQLSVCVAGKASKRVTLKHIWVDSKANDWEGCL